MKFNTNYNNIKNPSGDSAALRFLASNPAHDAAEEKLNCLDNILSVTPSLCSRGVVKAKRFGVIKSDSRLMEDLRPIAYVFIVKSFSVSFALIAELRHVAFRIYL